MADHDKVHQFLQDVHALSSPQPEVIAAIRVLFQQGVRFSDPNQHLEGKGKSRRHLKIYTLDDITAKTVSQFISQMVSIHDDG